MYKFSQMTQAERLSRFRMLEQEYTQRASNASSAEINKERLVLRLYLIAYDFKGDQTAFHRAVEQGQEQVQP